MNLGTIILAVVIEIISYLSIPIIIRILTKKPLEKKMAWYIGTIAFALIFTIYKVISAKLLDTEFSKITPDILSLIMYPIMIIILKFNKSNLDAKLIIKKIGAIALIIFGTAIMIISINYFNKPKKDNNTVYEVKEIKARELDSLIDNKNGVVIVYTYNDCIFCEAAMPIIEEVTKDYKLGSVYNLNAPVEEIDIYPTVAIYKNGKLIATKEGYTKENEMKELFYRTELVEFFSKHNIIKD